MSDFRTGRILGKRFPEAQVHTVHRTSAAGTSPMDSMDECFRKMLSQNSPRAEVAFSNICHSLKVFLILIKKEEKSISAFSTKKKLEN